VGDSVLAYIGGGQVTPPVSTGVLVQDDRNDRQ